MIRGFPLHHLPMRLLVSGPSFSTSPPFVHRLCALQIILHQSTFQNLLSHGPIIFWAIFWYLVTLVANPGKRLISPCPSQRTQAGHKRTRPNLRTNSSIKYYPSSSQPPLFEVLLPIQPNSCPQTISKAITNAHRAGIEVQLTIEPPTKAISVDFEIFEDILPEGLRRTSY
jgi:hypothetical protein